MTQTLANGRGTASVKGSAKAAHVNMMTDTIIANMPPDGLRVIMRGLLGGDPDLSLAKKINELSSDYLKNFQPVTDRAMFIATSTGSSPEPAFFQTQERYRCLMGCGYGFETVKSLTNVVRQTEPLEWEKTTKEGQALLDVLESIDGDIVQAVTAIQKELLTISGLRQMSEAELSVLGDLRTVMHACKDRASARGQEFAFERGFSSLLTLEGHSNEHDANIPPATSKFRSGSSPLESFELGSAKVPRMFMGLWQFSSPAWGTASKSKINADFRKHVNAGFTAYDMADHYGDAEVTFGSFRSSQPDAAQIYCATKWAVFEPIKVTKQVVEANLSERLININSKEIELLQFHWQDYNDHQFLEAARWIAEDPRVRNFGLCNFDTRHMEKLLRSGIKVVSNQVQFSLIDLRPTFKMAHSCRQYNVKLLTYGSLCGGFLADKWLGKPAPSPFDKDMTPSHRKYLEMIMVWGGWALFQDLLVILNSVANKYNVSISNVAIRWILDHDYVGAVIVGARMGISEHTEENLNAFTFRLDGDDQALIQSILGRSKAKDVFEAMGDCGSEYRQ